MSLTLETCFRGDVYIIRCTGHITAGHEVTSLEAALDMAEREFNSIVLNVSGVNRMDSMALGLLVRHTARLNKKGGTMRLALTPPFVAHLLSITKTSEFIKSYPSEEQAIESCLAQTTALNPGPATQHKLQKLLVCDPSADLCMFIHRVLSQHGFDVRTTCSLQDARILLIADQVDFIVVGPGTAQMPSALAANKLSSLAPKAKTLQLPPDFKSCEGIEAANHLLKLFGLPAA